MVNTHIFNLTLTANQSGLTKTRLGIYFLGPDCAEWSSWLATNHLLFLTGVHVSMQRDHTRLAVGSRRAGLLYCHIWTQCLFISVSLMIIHKP